MQCLSQLITKNKRTCQKSETLFKHVEKRMRSYLSGRRINITLIFMSFSSYLVHAISCRRILLKYRFLFCLLSFFSFGFPFFFFFFYFLRPDPPPATRYPPPVTRHPPPVTRHPRKSPAENKRFYWLVTNTPQSPSLKENSFCKTENENLLIYSLTIN